MSYDDFVSDVVQGVEAVGAGIMVVGGIGSLVYFALAALRADDRTGLYDRLRRVLGRVILLGLEILIIADIVRTIIVDPTLESVGALGLIVVIRIVLSFSLEIEMYGVWPWSRWRLGGEQGPANPTGRGRAGRSAPGTPPITDAGPDDDD